MAMTAAEKQRAYRARQAAEQERLRVTPDGNGNAPKTVTRVTKQYQLPALPNDEVIACNKDITWADILAMTKVDIDYVYKTWRAIGDDILLRLKRAAGYHRRVRA
jgi:hypothetical protein